ESGADTARAGELVALADEVLAHVRRSEHRTQALHRIEARLAAQRTRETMIDERFPGPVGAGNRTLETGHQHIGRDVGVVLARVGQEAGQAERSVRVFTRVE